MNAIVTLGYVMIETQEKDCDGMARTIDFPRVGNRLYGTPRYHWTVARYVREARRIARQALK